MRARRPSIRATSRRAWARATARAGSRHAGLGERRRARGPEHSGPEPEGQGESTRFRDRRSLQPLSGRHLRRFAKTRVRMRASLAAVGGSMVQGSCLCGEAAWEVAAPLELAIHCHCGICRKAHGVDLRELRSRAGAFVPLAARARRRSPLRVVAGLLPLLLRALWIEAPGRCLRGPHLRRARQPGGRSGRASAWPTSSRPRRRPGTSGPIRCRASKRGRRV